MVKVHLPHHTKQPGRRYWRRLDEDIVTVDSTLGWLELDGKIRIGSEVLTYTDKTVNQFLGCTRAKRQYYSIKSHCWF